VPNGFHKIAKGMTKLIKLRTSDEREFQVDRNVICQCNLIKGILEDLEGVNFKEEFSK
jgi:hypothetical protein